MSLLEHPRPIGNRASECALLVAKQGGVDQLRHDGTAVHRNKGRCRTRGGVVNGAGKQLFAGAGFTVDQHRHLLRREYLRLRLEHQHALALRHDAVEGCIHRGIQPGELNQLVGADGIGRWYILSRDFKRHLNLLHALLK